MTKKTTKELKELIQELSFLRGRVGTTSEEDRLLMEAHALLVKAKNLNPDITETMRTIFPSYKT